MHGVPMRIILHYNRVQKWTNQTLVDPPKERDLGARGKKSKKKKRVQVGVVVPTHKNKGYKRRHLIWYGG